MVARWWQERPRWLDRAIGIGILLVVWHLLAVTVLAVAVTVSASVWVARKEGLLTTV